MNTTKRDRREYIREYKKRNPEKVRQWKDVAKEKKDTRRKILGLDHPKKTAIKKQIFTEEQKAKRAEARKARHQENPEIQKARSAKYRANLIKRERLAEIALLEAEQKKEAKRQKRRDYIRQWYLKNSEKVSKKTAEYRKKNPDKRAKFAAIWRSRRYGQTDRYDAADAAKKIREMKSQIVGTCVYCHREFAMKSLTIDHIKPLARGGLHVARNLTLACRPCNLSKNSKILGEQWGNTTQAVGEKWYTRTGSNSANRKSRQNIKNLKDPQMQMEY